MILSSSSLITTPITPPQNHPSLHLLSKCKTMEEFKQIHAHMITTGLHNTQFALSKILHFCAINTYGDLPYALSVFNTMDEPPDQIMWNTIIRGYSLNSSPLSAIDFYRFMLLSGVQPNSYTFPSLFKSCARIDGTHEGKQIQGHVLKLGFGCDVFIHSSMVNFYVQSGELDDARLVFDKSLVRDVVSATALVTGYVRRGRLEHARKLFDEMPVRDVVSWNSIIAGHVRTQRFEEAIDIFNEMQRAKIKPNESTLVTVLSACAQSGCLTTGERIRTLIVDHGLGSNLRLANSLIDMYSKCSKLDEARTLFDTINTNNIISWNVMIGGYTRAQHYKESLDLFRSMLKSNHEPNEVTLLSVLPACAHTGALDLGKWVHGYIDKNFPESSNSSLSTSLIDMYSKCGDIEAARTVFESIKLKSLASWNAMISGLAMHRQAHNAVDLFNKMVDEGLVPDDITFVGVLSACSHAGLVTLGRNLFIAMIQDFKISPKLEHYGCLIDLLARGGLFEEATTVVKTMAVNPDGAIWGSLLGACTLSTNVSLGEYFAEKVLELDSENSGARVLLSNLYAADRRWDDVARVRTRFKDDGSKKVSGCSSIEVDGVVHEFLASDRAHPMSDEIYGMLEDTNRVVYEVGQGQVRVG